MGRAFSSSGLGWVALFLMLCVGVQGCSRKATEEDFVKARTVVQRVLVSDSYEDFMSYFTKDRQSRMKETAIWIRWWQEKISKGRGSWAVAATKDLGGGVIEVLVQHRRRPTSRQFYRLVREERSWAIQEIESER